MKKKRVRCHCCGKPSTDFLGNMRKVSICWACIREGGSTRRKCAVKHRLPVIGK